MTPRHTALAALATLLLASPALAGGSQPGGGSVSVTSASNDIVISPTPGTGTFTIASTNAINAQGTAASYAIQASDMGKTITHARSSAVADTLPTAGSTGFEAGRSFSIINTGAGTVTVTPTTSTINGSATLVLAQNQGATLTSDGSNYVALISGASSGGSSVSVTASTPNVLISPSPGTGTFTVGTTNAISAQGSASTYTIASTDMGKAVTHTATSAVTLPVASTTGFGSGAAYTEQNLGSGTVTITPTTSTINGQSSLKLYPYEAAYISSDGSNYSAFVGRLPTQYLTWQPGALTAATTGKAGFAKVSKPSTVDNIELSALTFACTVNPTVTFYECGTSATCASPTTIGSGTLTAANTVVDGTISAAAVTAGDYLAWAITAGTCTALDLAATAQIHTN